MNSREIIQRLEKDGWVHVRTKGSHWQFKHPTRHSLVTVPHPKKDFPAGTLRAIMRQAGWREI
jgi:predicted RNA binding protein YcfA (HicA-like mRNA interferase family)